MPDLLHEYWYDEAQAMGAFGPVSAHADRQRGALNPEARDYGGSHQFPPAWAPDWFHAEARSRRQGAEKVDSESSSGWRG